VTEPTPVTSIDAKATEIADHLGGERVAVGSSLRRQLGEVCAEVSDDDMDRAEAGRDWWPLAIGWAAAGEVRTWLEHLNMNDEVVKALSKMVIEVKTEIRFRPTEDGKVVTETSNDVKVKPPAR